MEKLCPLLLMAHAVRPENVFLIIRRCNADTTSPWQCQKEVCAFYDVLSSECALLALAQREVILERRRGGYNGKGMSVADDGYRE